MLSISSDITSPKPGTNSLPLGTSIFVSVFVSVELEAVGNDDVLSFPDDFTSALGISCGCASIGGGAGGGGGAGSGGGGGAIGLAGLTGLFTFVGFVTDFTQLF